MQKTDFSQPPSDALFALARGILFELDPENAHNKAMGLLSRRPARALLAHRYHTDASHVACLGLHFKNRLGLAAGFDKNGDYIDVLGAIGFGHIEIGTVTPRAQTGNPKPRIFRLTQHNALINRLGFNNKGVDYLVENVKRRKFTGKLGINIGKNASTPLQEAEQDYLYCLERVYAHADYVTVNISSPNTQGLRDLQHGKQLQSLLGAIKNAQAQLATQHDRYVPIAVKIAPDMTLDELDQCCKALQAFEIDAVIANNTSNTRDSVKDHLYASETGGLSGAPIRSMSDDTLKAISERIDGITLIGVGGVSCGRDAIHKLELGASLVQLYSGFIYHGPALIRDCIEATRTYSPN